MSGRPSWRALPKSSRIESTEAGSQVLIHSIMREPRSRHANCTPVTWSCSSNWQPTQDIIYMRVLVDMRKEYQR